MIVIDTNVVSELMRMTPEPAVMTWFSGQDSAELYLTAVSEAELRAGAAILPAGRRRDRLTAEVDAVVREDFAGRVLPFDSAAARAYAAIAASRRSMGRPILEADCQIAAIARASRRRGGDAQWRGLRALRDCAHRPMGGKPGVALTPPGRRRLHGLDILGDVPGNRRRRVSAPRPRCARHSRRTGGTGRTDRHQQSGPNSRIGEIWRDFKPEAALMEMVEEGVLVAHGRTPSEWRFTGRSLIRAQKALNLTRDLRVNWPCAALALDLLEEIEKLRLEHRTARHFVERTQTRNR